MYDEYYFGLSIARPVVPDNYRHQSEGRSGIRISSISSFAWKGMESTKPDSILLTLATVLKYGTQGNFVPLQTLVLHTASCSYSLIGTNRNN